jgi:hypothetical protein
MRKIFWHKEKAFTVESHFQKSFGEKFGKKNKGEGL